MSRESAIKFLRDISMGIDYLENAYSTNQIDPIDDNSLRVTITTNITLSMLYLLNSVYLFLKFVTCKKSTLFQISLFHSFCFNIKGYPPTVATTTTTTTSTTTQKPIILVEKSIIAPIGEITSPLMRLNEISNEKTKGEYNVIGNIHSANSK